MRLLIALQIALGIFLVTIQLLRPLDMMQQLNIISGLCVVITFVAACIVGYAIVKHWN